MMLFIVILQFIMYYRCCPPPPHGYVFILFVQVLKSLKFELKTLAEPLSDVHN